MTMDLAHSYAQIIKQEKQEDGTLLVYGKATDDALDIDQQICDAAWLEKAMPEWFKTGGNIREQHSNIAAGVAKELDSKADGHYISALVVDPISVKKVETGVLKGFSIGIRSPRIVRDTKAANGRIIDGQIVEISLVDRPANPNAKLMLAKCDNELDLIKVEEYAETENIEKHGDHDQSDHAGGGGSDKPEPENENLDRERPESGWNSSDQQTVNDAVMANEEVTQGLNNLNDEDSDEFIEEGLSDDDENLVDDAMDSLKEANEALESSFFAKTEEERARHLDTALVRMDEAASSLNNADSRAVSGYAKDVEDAMEEIEQMYDALDIDKSVKTTKQKERAMARTKKVTKSVHEEDKAAAEKPSKEDLMKQYKEAKKALDDISAMCKEAGVEIEIDGEEEKEKAVGESAEEETEEGSKPEAAEEEVEEAEGKKPLDKSDAVKCLECGCDKPSDAHGRTDVTTAEMVSPTETPKSLETIVPLTDVDGTDVVETVTEEDSSDDEDLSNKTITAIIEKAVKSAKDAITIEVNSYQEEINKLNAELATAKTKAVAGGPKRSVIKPAVIAELGDVLQKAAEYRAKSAVTDDKDLARGYKELASDFEAKALVIQANK
jgi:hypothetical protein